MNARDRRIMNRLRAEGRLAKPTIHFVSSREWEEAAEPRGDVRQVFFDEAPIRLQIEVVCDFDPNEISWRRFHHRRCDYGI